MDMHAAQRAIEWVQGNIGDHTTKQELLSKAHGSDLPREAKDLFLELPEGQRSKDSIISMLRDRVVASVGGSGGIGGMFGR